MSKWPENFKLDDPHAGAEVSRSSNGTPELDYYFADDGAVMTFTFGDKEGWDAVRRLWRVIRRYGSARLDAPNGCFTIYPVNGDQHHLT